MFAEFLPIGVRSLSETPSIQLAQAIERQAVQTSLQTAPLFIPYTCQGEADPPLMLLHGFDSSQLEFRFLCPYLTPDQQTWTVDLLGFGFNPPPQGVAVNPMTIKTALYAFWESAIARPMVLVGASMGGAVALDFTLTYPDAVAKLVLIDSTGYTNTPEFVKFLISPLDRLGVAYLRWRKLWALQLSRLGGADARWQDLLYCAVLHQEMPKWKESILEFNKSGGYNFLPPRIPNINKPTLILWGEADEVLGIEDATKFAETIAHSQLVWIANAGHAPHIEQPEVTAQHILSFIQH